MFDWVLNTLTVIYRGHSLVVWYSLHFKTFIVIIIGAFSSYTNMFSRNETIFDSLAYFLSYEECQRKV